MNSRKSQLVRLILFLAIAAVGFGSDLATKHWIFNKLGLPGRQDVWWIVPDVFGFQTSLNQGALFGLGQGQITLFVTLSIIALLGVALWVWTDPGKNLALASTLGLITAGILGNLWDRVGLHHMTWTQFDVDVWSCSQDMVGKPVAFPVEEDHIAGLGRIVFCIGIHFPLGEAADPGGGGTVIGERRLGDVGIVQAEGNEHGAPVAIRNTVPITVTSISL